MTWPAVMECGVTELQAVPNGAMVQKVVVSTPATLRVNVIGEVLVGEVVWSNFAEKVAEQDVEKSVELMSAPPPFR